MIPQLFTYLNNIHDEIIYTVETTEQNITYPRKGTKQKGFRVLFQTWTQ